MLNQIGLLVYTKLFGHYVGADRYNNKYYCTKNGEKEKRWVVYNGMYDPTKISAQWHGWLHHSHEHPLPYSKNTWAPNKTGTSFAKKYVTSIEKLPQTALQCYKSWSPDK